MEEDGDDGLEPVEAGPASYASVADYGIEVGVCLQDCAGGGVDGGEGAEVELVGGE